ncbi:hypothetical protein LSH36_46g03012 [Paralvinella palmiformis]|uniref:Uncharacterized protein n=1 Tax=Paralvinella palmiformis TaxID=53620 RepID=A0AAD9K752_9ANNE|nr:hypothetical protein LSH36_46g03012 [Paralvinella palmiformis]
MKRHPVCITSTHTAYATSDTTIIHHFYKPEFSCLRFYFLDQKLGPVCRVRSSFRRDNTFDILGEDHLLLTRLCYTLGIIMYAALNAPLVRQMSKSLTEFIWTLRYHPQPAVRQSLLFVISMMLLAVPSHMLLSELPTEMVDMKNWLEDVIEKDNDNDCKQLAIQAMVLLTKALKQCDVIAGHRHGPSPQTLCRHCQQVYDPVHYLLNCPAYPKNRRSLKGHLRPEDHKLPDRHLAALLIRKSTFLPDIITPLLQKDPYIYQGQIRPPLWTSG